MENSKTFQKMKTMMDGVHQHGSFEAYHEAVEKDEQEKTLAQMQIELELLKQKHAKDQQKDQREYDYKLELERRTIREKERLDDLALRRELARRENVSTASSGSKAPRSMTISEQREYYGSLCGYVDNLPPHPLQQFIGAVFSCPYIKYAFVGYVSFLISYRFPEIRLFLFVVILLSLILFFILDELDLI